MSFFKNKIVIVIISVTVAVFILGGVLAHSGSGPVANAVGVVFSPIQRTASFVASSIDRFTVFVWEMKSYKEENERLVSEINELKKQNRTIEDYKNENERLTELLGLKDTITDYNTVAARIIAYEPDNWYETIVINRGKNSGVNVEDVVMTSSGIVGQVTDVGSNWARVSAIINMDNSVGVRVVRTGDIAITEGDIALGKDGYCKMSFMSKDASVIVGDILETSGLGGVYPPGMTVGTIKEIISEDGMQSAVVEPSVNFDNLREVLVITDVQ